MFSFIIIKTHLPVSQPQNITPLLSLKLQPTGESVGVCVCVCGFYLQGLPCVAGAKLIIWMGMKMCTFPNILDQIIKFVNGRFLAPQTFIPLFSEAPGLAAGLRRAPPRPAAQLFARCACSHSFPLHVQTFRDAKQPDRRPKGCPD